MSDQFWRNLNMGWTQISPIIIITHSTYLNMRRQVKMSFILVSLFLSHNFLRSLHVAKDASTILRDDWMCSLYLRLKILEGPTSSFDEEHHIFPHLMNLPFLFFFEKVTLPLFFPFLFCFSSIFVIFSFSVSWSYFFRKIDLTLSFFLFYLIPKNPFGAKILGSTQPSNSRMMGLSLYPFKLKY